MVSKCVIGFIAIYVVLSIFLLHITRVINLFGNKSKNEEIVLVRAITPFQAMNRSRTPYKGPKLSGFTQVGYPPFGNFQENGVKIDDNELIISDQLNFTLDKCRDDCANNELCGAFNFNMENNECIQFGNKTTTSTNEPIIAYTKN